MKECTITNLIAQKVDSISTQFSYVNRKRFLHQGAISSVVVVLFSVLMGAPYCNRMGRAGTGGRTYFDHSRLV